MSDWVSYTSLLCMMVQGGVEGSVRLVGTAGLQEGSQSMGVSIDLQSLSSALQSNQESIAASQ